MIEQLTNEVINGGVYIIYMYTGFARLKACSCEDDEPNVSSLWWVGFEWSEVKFLHLSTVTFTQEFLKNRCSVFHAEFNMDLCIALAIELPASLANSVHSISFMWNETWKILKSTIHRTCCHEIVTLLFRFYIILWLPKIIVKQWNSVRMQ